MNKNLTKILFSIALISSICFTLTSCKGTGGPTTKVTGGAAPEKNVSMQSKTTSGEPKDLTALHSVIKDIEKGDFDAFKVQVAEGLNHVSKGIPELKDKNKALPSDVEKKIAIINETTPKIKQSKTPQEIIPKEQAAFDSAISALKTIANQTANKDLKTAVNSNLDQAKQLSTQLNTKNYKTQTKEIFIYIHDSMYELHKKSKTKHKI